MGLNAAMMLRTFVWPSNHMQTDCLDPWKWFSIILSHNNVPLLYIFFFFLLLLLFYRCYEIEFSDKIEHLCHFESHDTKLKLNFKCVDIFWLLFNQSNKGQSLRRREFSYILMMMLAMMTATMVIMNSWWNYLVILVNGLGVVNL